MESGCQCLQPLENNRIQSKITVKCPEMLKKYDIHLSKNLQDYEYASMRKSHLKLQQMPEQDSHQVQSAADHSWTVKM